jgi:xylulokinase
MSEGIFWDFKKNALAGELLHHFGFPAELIPDLIPTFSVQGHVTSKASEELGLYAGIPVSYRAGDQPNNAFSLNVLNPGEIAATAGTSGVVYGVSDVVAYDPQSRINTFAHVNHSDTLPRLGMLLCINGTGILNAWIKKNSGFETCTYEYINELASHINIGSDGLVILPFGNGSERVLGNLNPGCWMGPVSFNSHSREHLLRAAQEGIVFAFHYGMNIMKQIGIHPSVIRAGHANLFLSPVFTETLAGITGISIEIYDTDGALGAAKGAGIGSGIYHSHEEAFRSLRKIHTVYPDSVRQSQYQEAYTRWFQALEKITGTKYLN